ncbi:MFS transporter, partial [Candidatus Gracilibacteria bacterium]|nr:MFS transporter [Candidatus Gracilibacteria bacterium]
MQVPSFILKHTEIKGEKMWQFYILIAGWTAIYTAMSISVLLFLQHVFDSLFIAGLAIAIGNSVSFFLDGFIASLQKRFHSRQLFLSGIGLMIISLVLFIIFSNPIFVFFAAIIFSVSFDIVDITSMSYIMAKTLPANYGIGLSYKETSRGIGLLFGLLISGILISSSYFLGDLSDGTIKMTAEMLKIQNANFESSLFISQILLMVILLALFFFAFILFDKDAKILSKDYVVASFQELKSETIKGLKNSAISIKQQAFDKVKNLKNSIELKSTYEKKSLNWNEIFGEIFIGIALLKDIFVNKNKNFSLFWLIIVSTIFSYWDTFLGTFFPLFFTEFLKAQTGWLREIPGSILSLLLILPVLGLFPVMSKMGDRFGRFKFIYGGLGATAFAVFMMGIMDYQRFTMFIFMGLVTS